MGLHTLPGLLLLDCHFPAPPLDLLQGGRLLLPGLLDEVVQEAGVLSLANHRLQVHAVVAQVVGAVPQAGDNQVWSLTQFYSDDFSQSRIDVKKCVFSKRTNKVCVRCC